MIESVESTAVKVAVPATVEETLKVATPELFVVAEIVLITSLAPREEERLTVFPETGLELVSFNVTVIVESEVPFAVSELGAALTAEVDALTNPAVKEIAVVWVMVSESLASTAVRVADPVVVDLTVKVATPELLVVPETVVIVSVAPREEEIVTVFPDTRLELESFKVTVIEEVLEPSAVTEAGAALTVDRAALTAPAVKLTAAVWTTVIESLESFAV